MTDEINVRMKSDWLLSKNHFLLLTRQKIVERRQKRNKKRTKFMKVFTFDLDLERGITTMEMIMMVFLFQHIYTDSHICSIKKYFHQILSQS